MARLARSIDRDDRRRFVPVHAVWEITLACDLHCRHCGSRAGRRRPAELSTQGCLEVVDALAELGTREVTLIGGEAYLRRDWLEIIRALVKHGIRVSMQSGGRNFTQRRLDDAVEAGLASLGVSIDGLEATHDGLRGLEGSFARAIDTLRRAKAAGLVTSVNTQICAQTMAELPELLDTVIEVGGTHWQLQLTVAMGNAVDNPELLLQPYQLLKLMPTLAELYRRALDHGVLMTAGNNIGYFGPYEHLWRGFGDERRHWTGCGAGQLVMGIEADGTIKGCPSLETTSFAGGKVGEVSLAQLWDEAPEIHFGRLRSRAELWGFCRTCYYAELCRGGCTWTAHSLFGRAGNNPYCHHRALELAAKGLRERVVKRRDAAKRPFAIGEFELVVEGLDGAERPEVPRVSGSPTLVPLSRLLRPTGGPGDAREGRIPEQLELCRGCNQYVHANEQLCPHCGADVASEAARHARARARRRAVIDTLRRQLGEIDEFDNPRTPIE
jgi:Y-X(10)_GDL-associated radical SAM protein